MRLSTIIENFTDYPSENTAQAALKHLTKYPNVVNQVSKYNRERIASFLIKQHKPQSPSETSTNANREKQK